MVKGLKHRISVLYLPGYELNPSGLPVDDNIRGNQDHVPNQVICCNNHPPGTSVVRTVHAGRGLSAKLADAVRLYKAKRQ